MELLKQEYWSGLPIPSPKDLPDPGIELGSPALPKHSDSDGKESTCNTGAAKYIGSTPGLGRSPGGGNDNPLQYSCLESPMDREAWWAIVHGYMKRVEHDSGCTHRCSILSIYSI